MTFASKQYGTGYDDIGCRVFGPQRHDRNALRRPRVASRGEKSYKGGRRRASIRDGAFKNIADFHAAIMKGDYANATVAPSVRSNLTTILGRTAAYKRAEVTWDEVIKTAEKFEFDTTG